MRIPVALAAMLFFSCAEIDTPSGRIDTAGYLVYKEHCVLCHGESGADQISGAKDLVVSTLDRKQTLFIVKHGRGNMRAYSELLTEEQVDDVVDYVFLLRNK